MKEAVEMLVLPIKTLLDHYIYDANRNEILAVSKDFFNYISEVQAGEVCPDSYKSDQEFQLLQNSSYYNHVATAAIRHCRMSLIHQLAF